MAHLNRPRKHETANLRLGQLFCIVRPLDRIRTNPLRAQALSSIRMHSFNATRYVHKPQNQNEPIKGSSTFIRMLPSITCQLHPRIEKEGTLSIHSSCSIRCRPAQATECNRMNSAHQSRAIHFELTSPFELALYSAPFTRKGKWGLIQFACREDAPSVLFRPIEGCLRQRAPDSRGAKCLRGQCAPMENTCLQTFSRASKTIFGFSSTSRIYVVALRSSAARRSSDTCPRQRDRMQPSTDGFLHGVSGTSGAHSDSPVLA